MDVRDGTADRQIAPDPGHALLVEVAWEICNQVGGIYTVLRSKAPVTVQRWGKRLCLVGPYIPEQAAVEFDEELPPNGVVGEAIQRMRSWGYEVRCGTWAVTGRPPVILLPPASVAHRLDEIKYLYWEHHAFELPPDELLDGVLCFGFLVEVFLRALIESMGAEPGRRLLAHFHEWMGASALPELRYHHLPIATVFTTHATLLGRYLATSDPQFYEHLPLYDAAAEAQRLGIAARVQLERAAAHGAHVFTTVSEVTSWECENLIGRKVDLVLPNGLNIQRFTARHELQNLHQAHKLSLHERVMAHFFHCYSFDLDRTLYFFTSGRYEFGNKGFDLTVEALARLNARMRQAGSPTTVVMFFITRRPYKWIDPLILQTRGVLEELRRTCRTIEEQLGDRLFHAAAASEDHRLPRLDELVDDYWKLRLRRTMQSWRSGHSPLVVTHVLEDEAGDELLAALRSAGLDNAQEDRVKVVYHPEFISPTNPVWGMEYDHFVRGCHLGIFPSYYEPWGYTPLECMARGIPAVTSDLSGFGAFLRQHLPDHESRGLHVVQRRHRSFEGAASELAEYLWGFTQLTRRERIALRNRVEESAGLFDWQPLSRYYEQAHALALERAAKEP